MREALIGKDPAFLAAVAMARRAAEGRLPAILVGPSGSGKSHLTRWMARFTSGAEASGLEWNAAAVPDTLLEAELRGVESGAATGVDGRPGIAETAGRGILCLVHLERLSLHQQAALLRVLEEKQVVRVGGQRPRAVHAQVIAAFQDPPEGLAASGLLREDLLYRMDVLRVELPSLAARREDVPDLFLHFLRRSSKAAGKAAPTAAPSLLRALQEHPWPGNLWQLRQTADLLAQSRSDSLSEEELPASFWLKGEPVAEAASRRLTLAELKDAYIRAVLARVGGRRTRAAQWLGISRKALWEHLKRGSAQKED
jgi:two-component system, NtrC family, response regulator HydG